MEASDSANVIRAQEEPQVILRFTELWRSSSKWTSERVAFLADMKCILKHLSLDTFKTSRLVVRGADEDE